MSWIGKLFKNNNKRAIAQRLPEFEALEEDILLERVYDNLPDSTWNFVANSYRNDKLISSEVFNFQNETILHQSENNGLKVYSPNGYIYSYPNGPETLTVGHKDNNYHAQVVIKKSNGLVDFKVQGTNENGIVLSKEECLKLITLYFKNSEWGNGVFGFNNRYQYPFNEPRPRRFISKTPSNDPYHHFNLNGKRYKLLKEGYHKSDLNKKLGSLRK